MNAWPHAPPHRLFEPGSYMVTGATLHKEHFFRSPARLRRLTTFLLRTLAAGGWQVQAWAVFSNHYHFVAFSPHDVDALRELLGKIHARSAAALNVQDGTPERPVWFQFWETHLTIRTSYFARLRYVHENAVHHGLVRHAGQYPWCSTPWLEQQSDPAFRQMLATFGTARLRVSDDYPMPPPDAAEEEPGAAAEEMLGEM